MRRPDSTGPAAPRAFTLIELLIVVGIIALLAAVAVPNFIVARDRARVARVRADHRTLATALEAYRIDQTAQVYPSANSQGSLKWLCWLTTPIAYMTNVNLEDPFTGATAIKTSSDWNLSYTSYRYYAFNEMGFLNAASADGTVIKSTPRPAHCGFTFTVSSATALTGCGARGATARRFWTTKTCFSLTISSS